MTDSKRRRFFVDDVTKMDLAIGLFPDGKIFKGRRIAACRAWHAGVLS